MEKFKNYTIDQIESVFDQLNLYGLSLLFPTVLAWEYSGEKGADLLRKAYDDMLESKENDSKEEYRTPYTDKTGLSRILKKLDEEDFDYIGSLLELDSHEVFVDNPMTNYKSYESDDLDYEPRESETEIFKKFYDSAKDKRLGIVKKVDPITAYEQSLIDESNRKFSARFYKSLKLKRPEDGYSSYSK